MRDLKVGKKYLKHIIKSNLGKAALRRLEIKTVGNFSLHSNIFYKAGFYFRVYVYFENNTPKASVLLYNYYFNHTYLKDKSVTSITSILRCKLGYNKYDYKYIKSEDSFELWDRVFAIPYSKELFFNFYSAVEKINTELDFGKTCYYGDGYGKDRIEYLFEKNEIKIKQGNFQISLETLMNCSLRYLIGRVNYIRSLKLDDISVFELNENSLVC
jgi:hypothetical protein